MSLDLSNEINFPQLDLLIDEVVADLANPPMSASLEERLGQIPQLQQDRSFTMPAATLNNNLIAFDTFSRMKSGRSSRTTYVWATIAHVAALLLIMAQVRAMRMEAPMKVSTLTIEDAPLPPKAPPKAVTMGGGGGQKGPTPVTHGTPPQFAPMQLNPPKIAVENAKLTPPVTVDVDPNLKMTRNDAMPIGMMNSPAVGVSMGNGTGSGIGSGNGNGIGPGSGGGIGGSLRRIGGGVSAPEILFKPEPEFSEEARRTKTAGNVLVYLQVGADGLPRNIRVLKGIGMGLDEKALEAVRQYKFKPAMENGHPVAVELNVEIEFHVY